MKPLTHNFKYLLIPIVLTLLAVILPANSSLAHEIDEERRNEGARQGLFLGVNAGAAGGVLRYKVGTHTITEEGKGGGLGGLRFGYAFSPKFALSLEGFSFTSKMDDQDWRINTLFLATTFHPCGSGFFLRAGLGAGGGHFTQPVSGNQVTTDEGVAFLFSMGYDWGLNDHLSLGFSLDSMGVYTDGASGFNNDGIGIGGMTVQFNWYL